MGWDVGSGPETDAGVVGMGTEGEDGDEEGIYL